MKLVIAGVMVVAICWWRWPEVTASTFDLGRGSAAVDEGDEDDDEVVASDDVQKAVAQPRNLPTYDPWAEPLPVDPRAPALPEEDPPAVEAFMFETSIQDALQEVRAVLEECSAKQIPKPSEKYIVRLWASMAREQAVGSGQTFTFFDEYGRSLQPVFESCIREKLAVMGLPELPEAFSIIVRPRSN